MSFCFDHLWVCLYWATFGDLGCPISEWRSMEACGSPVFWIETSGSVSRQFHFKFNGGLSMKVVDDSRTVVHRVVDSLLNKFFFLLGIHTV